MEEESNEPSVSAPSPDQACSSGESSPSESGAECCPVCGGRLQQEKCKVLCRSQMCGYRIVYNCSEF